jgi:hypothetical protein
MSAPVRPTSLAAKPEVSLLYLCLLRVGYALLAFMMGSAVWPALLHHETWPLTLGPFESVGNSMLAGLSLLSVAGLRYPLKMLPLLLFETTWKAIWLIVVALPLWLNHAPVPDDVAQTAQACLMAVIFPILIPWRYVFTNFVLGTGDRWK